MNNKSQELIDENFSQAESFEVLPMLAAREYLITLDALNEARKRNPKISIVLHDSNAFGRIRNLVREFESEVAGKTLEDYVQMDFQTYADGLEEDSVILKMLFESLVDEGFFTKMPPDVYLALKMNVLLADGLKELHEELHGIDRENHE